MTDHFKSIARAAVAEVWNEGRIEVLDEMALSSLIYHAPTLETALHGVDAVKEYVLAVRTAFPNFHVTVTGDLISDEHNVVGRWVARGTHEGVYFDLPPSGRSFELHGISIFRFGSGKIAEIDEMFDRMSFMQQLGVSGAALD